MSDETTLKAAEAAKVAADKAAADKKAKADKAAAAAAKKAKAASDAKAKTEEDDKPQKGSFLVVCHAGAGRRRGGIAWEAGTTAYPEEEMTEELYAALEADPLFTVSTV